MPRHARRSATKPSRLTASALYSVPRTLRVVVTVRPNVNGRPPAANRGGGRDAECATITAVRITRRPESPFAVGISDLPEPIRGRVTVDPESGCWRCSLNHDRDGYARLRGEGVHRIAYKTLVGPIPDHLVIDHVRARGCAWTDCCNPAHLEPVTRRVNTLRGTSFAALNFAKTNCGTCGEPYDLINTYVWRGRRDCRACIRRRVREYKGRQRQQPERRRSDLTRAA